MTSSLPPSLSRSLARLVVIGLALAVGCDPASRNGQTELVTLAAITPAKLAVTAVSASAHDGNVPANTIDGNLGTRWSASGDGQWIQYDLGSNKTVSLVKIAFYKGNERTATFDILTSTNATSWTTVISRATSTLTLSLQTFDFTDVDPARYVRIVGHGNSSPTSGQWNSLTEVEIWGGATQGGQVATPTFMPGAGTYASAQSVTIATSTTGASIRYTTDGSTPTTTTGTLYTGPVTVSTSTTLKAVAYASGMTTSAVATAVYTISTGTDTKFSIPGTSVTASADDGNGNVASKTVDGIVSSTSRWSANGNGQWIRYDLGGNRRVAFVKIAFYLGDARVYTFDLQSSTDGVAWSTLRAGVQSAMNLSLQTFDFPDVDPARYIRYVGHSNNVNTWNSLTEVEVYGGPSSGGGGQVAAPTFNPGSGTYTTAQSVTIASSTAGASIRYTSDGSTPTPTTGTPYTGPVIVNSSSTLRAIAFKTGMTDSTVTSASYIISTCTPETDAAFCSRLGKNCGTVTAPDNCGQSRTVSSCGTCTSPQTCGGGGVPNVCGGGGTAPPGSPVALNGQLHVCGRTICNQNNKAIQLRGMSTHGLQWYGWNECITRSSLDSLAADWGADILRMSMYVQEGGYETNPPAFKAQIDAIVAEVLRLGLYAIVDWHMLDPGDPNANLTLAREYFTWFTTKYGSHPNFLYEIANEPNGVSWATIKNYANQMIPVVRDKAPGGIIIIGTRGWSSFGVSDGSGPAEVINSPVAGSNLMYTFHFYAASHGSEYRAALITASDSLPVFVTEWGTQTFTGDGANNFTSSQQYIDIMAQRKISWTSWNYSDDFRSGAAFVVGTCQAGGPWTGSSLKPAGTWVQQRILSPADDF